MTDGHADPLISVVTASFNALDGLKRTIASVAEQDLRSVEHIIVDGGSNDGTLEYLDGLGQKVRWVSEPDEGIADALNKGVALAAGAYVLILQADDIFLDEKSLSRAVPWLSSDTDIVACEVALRRFDGTSERRRSRPLGWLTHFKMTSPHQGMFVRRSLYERIGAFDSTYKIAMDYEFLLKAKRHNASLVAVGETLAAMPANGVSTQTDWASTRRRLAEDRRLQLQHATGWPDRIMTHMFWTAYRPFKRIKTIFATGSLR